MGQRMPKLLPILSVAASVLACTGAGTDEVKTTQNQLKPSSALTTSCNDWPNKPFNRKNRAQIATFVERGDAATNFSLRDTAGTSHSLEDLLAEKPVLLLQGSYTCPRYQENQPGIRETAKRFADDIHTVLVYNIEAHPGEGDPTPYHGKPKPKEFSDRPQANDYDTRAANAGDVSLSEDVLVLVDDLSPDSANPIWCTYGTCPSCSFLIRQDGVIEAVHLWHDAPSMDGSIQALLDAGS